MISGGTSVSRLRLGKLFWFVGPNGLRYCVCERERLEQEQMDGVSHLVGKRRIVQFKASKLCKLKKEPLKWRLEHWKPQLINDSPTNDVNSSSPACRIKNLNGPNLTSRHYFARACCSQRWELLRRRTCLPRTKWSLRPESGWQLNPCCSATFAELRLGDARQSFTAFSNVTPSCCHKSPHSHASRCPCASRVARQNLRWFLYLSVF